MTRSLVARTDRVRRLDQVELTQERQLCAYRTACRSEPAGRWDPWWLLRSNEEIQRGGSNVIARDRRAVFNYEAHSRNPGLNEVEQPEC